MKKINIQTSLFTKISLFLITLIAILITTFTILNYIQSKKNNYQNLKFNLLLTESQNVEKINLLINNNITLCNNIALLLSNIDSIPENSRRDYISNVLYSIIAQKNDIYAIWSVFKPYSIDNLDLKYSISKDKITGQFAITYYQIGEKILQKEVELTDYQKLNNTINIFQTYKIYIRPTVKDNYSIINKKNHIIQITSPIVLNKKTIGIVGIDIDYQLIKTLIKTPGHYYIINENLDIIFSNNFDEIGKNLKTILPLINQSRIPKHIFASDRIVDEEQLKSHNKNELYSIIPISIKDYPINYYYISLYDQQKINKTYQTTTNNIFWISLIVFVLASFIVILLALIISQNLQYLNTELSEILTKTHKFRETKNFQTTEFQQIQNKIELIKKQLTNYESFVDALIDEKYDIQIEIAKNSLTDKLIKLKNKSQQEKQVIAEQLRQQEFESLMNKAIGDINNLQLTYINDVEKLVYEIIKYISDFTQAVQGGFYLAEEQQNRKILNLIAFYSYNRKVFYKKTIDFGDGMAGTCALEKKIIYSKVPPNYLEIKSGFGAMPPDYIFLVPLIHTNEVLGIMEFAFIKEISQFHQNFIINAANVVASAIFTSQTTYKTDKLLKETEKIKKELEDKEKLMQKQIEQLEQYQQKSQEIELDLSAIISSVEKILYFAEMDVKSNILNINNLLSQRLQIQVSDAMLLTYFDLFYIADTDTHKKYFETVLKGKSVEFELPIILGKFNIWMKAILAPVYNIQRQIYKILFFGIDITDLKIKEQDLLNIKQDYHEKLEQLKVQEAEMDFVFTDYQNLQDLVKQKEDEIAELQKQIENTKNSYDFLQKEFQKRINHYTRIELNLKERIKFLEEEIKRLGGEI